MKAKYNKRGKTLIASISGELDQHYASEVRHDLDAKISGGCKDLVFDFSGLEFMDSSGIGVIVGRYKAIKSMGGKVRIANINPQVSRIIKLSGIEKIIPVYDSVNSALSSL